MTTDAERCIELIESRLRGELGGYSKDPLNDNCQSAA